MRLRANGPERTRLGERGLPAASIFPNEAFAEVCSICGWRVPPHRLLPARVRTKPSGPAGSRRAGLSRGCVPRMVARWPLGRVPSAAGKPVWATGTLHRQCPGRPHQTIGAWRLLLAGILELLTRRKANRVRRWATALHRRRRNGLVLEPNCYRQRRDRPRLVAGRAPHRLPPAIHVLAHPARRRLGRHPCPRRGGR